VSELQINNVELCMGNKKDVFKLFSLVLGALCSQEGGKSLVERGTATLSEEQA
jgi:hypothetical protein